MRATYRDDCRRRIRHKERARRNEPLALSQLKSRRSSKMALAPADCPTQLPAQYRRRWSVSRPCSGRERVGPLRKRHQGHSCWTDIEPCGLARPPSPPPWAGRDEHARMQRLKVCLGEEDEAILSA